MDCVGVRGSGPGGGGSVGAEPLPAARRACHAKTSDSAKVPRIILGNVGSKTLDPGTVRRSMSPKQKPVTALTSSRPSRPTRTRFAATVGFGALTIWLLRIRLRAMNRWRPRPRLRPVRKACEKVGTCLAGSGDRDEFARRQSWRQQQGGGGRGAVLVGRCGWAWKTPVLSGSSHYETVDVRHRTGRSRSISLREILEIFLDSPD